MNNNNHSHKKPLLQKQVSQKERIITNILYYVSMGFFILMLAFTFAGVTL